ncbi:hypothetical protein [Streptomyces sp. 4N124]|uniref:hypothetical protein n=1 Tax=Streptomyces sp. 4N124 TaxID=3457420 RepID=UPI003FD1A8A8
MDFSDVQDVPALQRPSRPSGSRDPAVTAMVWGRTTTREGLGRTAVNERAKTAESTSATTASDPAVPRAAIAV